MESAILNTNSLAFIALCNEYCAAIEDARESEKDEFVQSMLRLLPRLYISATDLKIDLLDEEDAYLEPILDEDYYESVRCGIENLMGPEDIFLEVFEEDMKYSDTPIAASISESLADIFQVLYNFVGMVKEAPEQLIPLALVAVRDEFQGYWSRILCNVLRALNQLRYNSAE
ncbi:MAG: DUF5063 domain-containing protein [Muribaculaceae bacterium]|nr:DUF5063 domain-containing protein [Muribaculaceae bacterium]